MRGKNVIGLMTFFRLIRGLKIQKKKKKVEGFFCFLTLIHRFIRNFSLRITI
jgi:hypothetical protein